MSSPPSARGPVNNITLTTNGHLTNGHLTNGIVIDGYPIMHGDGASIFNDDNESTMSVASATLPRVPNNTPATSSMGHPVDTESVDQHIERLDLSEGESGVNSTQQNNINATSDETTGGSISPREGLRVSIGSNVSEQFSEHSLWKDEALEHLENSLKKLATLATDLNMTDGSKSVEEYYSKLLADTIKGGAVRFDKQHLD